MRSWSRNMRNRYNLRHDRCQLSNKSSNKMWKSPIVEQNFVALVSDRWSLAGFMVVLKLRMGRFSEPKISKDWRRQPILCDFAHTTIHTFSRILHFFPATTFFLSHNFSEPIQLREPPWREKRELLLVPPRPTRKSQSLVSIVNGIVSQASTNELS